MTLIAFLTLGLTVFVAAFAQGATGMGFAMLSAPLVTLLSPGLIPVMLLVLMVPLNAYVAWRERGAVDWHGVKLITVGRFIGTFFGLWVLWVVNLHQLALLIGWSTLIAVVIAALSPAFRMNRTGLASVGLITGITETATGVGGPPLALAYQHRSGPELRSTLALCFLIGELISLAMLAAGSKLDRHTLAVSAQMLPFLAAGCYASRFVHHRLDGSLLRYTVLGLSGLSACALLVQA